MDRKGKGERDSSEDKSDRGSEDFLNMSSGAAGGDSSGQQYDSEGAACSDQRNT
jgi:hypothetical protein